MRRLETILEQMVARDPLSLNTDWDGTLVIMALLEWERVTGEERFGDFAQTWFEHHRDYTHRLTDEEYYASYTGIGSKIIRMGPIPFTAYCGHWGLVYPLPGITERVKDGTPQQVASAIADYLVHSAPRSFHGCIYHDDRSDFLIPDTCYFAAPTLAIASHLTGKEIYLEQAIHQLTLYVKLMQDPQTGLAHTLWNPSGMPRNFWSRASGWMAGAYMNTLRYVPKDRREYAELVASFQRLAVGVMKMQRADGGFHVLLDRKDTPVDCTGSAMLGLALRQGIALGILDVGANAAAEAAWEATQRHIDENGHISGAYTSWAKPALMEQFAADDFDKPRDFVHGLILLAGSAFYEKKREVQR